MSTHEYQIKVVHNHEPDYLLLKLMVASNYQQHYSADVDVNPDQFIALCSAQGEWLACFGVNFSKNKRLFSENYLDGSIEDVLGPVIECSVKRAVIAECGSFASLTPGAGKVLLSSLSWVLWCEGIHYGLVTVTPVVRHLFRRLKMPFVEICAADIGRLSQSDLAQWGSYYSTEPVTGVLDIRQGLLNSMETHSGKYKIRELNVVEPKKTYQQAA